MDSPNDGSGQAWDAMPNAPRTGGFESSDDEPVPVGPLRPDSSDDENGGILRFDGRFEHAAGQEGLSMAEALSLHSALHNGLQNNVCNFDESHIIQY
jgi:hypothetical protein